MFFQQFDSILILNLPHRTDRRSEMMGELRRHGIANDPRVRFFAGSTRDEAGCFSGPGVHGCYMSHLAALKEAANKGGRVLILEDDCEFTSDASDYAPPSDWDIFYGGYLADDPDNLQTSNIIGAHCMAYSPKAAVMLAKYLEDLLNPNFPPDPVAATDAEFDPSIKPPFDGAIVWFRRAHPQLKTEFAQIAVQRSSRSDIADGNLLDRTIPGLAAGVRKVKNRIRRLF